MTDMEQLDLFNQPAEPLTSEEECKRLRALADHYANLLYQMNSRYAELSVAYGRLRYAAHIATGRIPAE